MIRCMREHARLMSESAGDRQIIAEYIVTLASARSRRRSEKKYAEEYDRNKTTWAFPTQGMFVQLVSVGNGSVKNPVFKTAAAISRMIKLDF